MCSQHVFQPTMAKGSTVLCGFAFGTDWSFPRRRQGHRDAVGWCLGNFFTELCKRLQETAVTCHSARILKIMARA